MSTLAGTGTLVRLILRRDRLTLAMWIGGLVMVTIATAAALATLVPTAESRALFAAGITGNPSMVALVGPLFDATTIGGLLAWRLGGMGSVLVALMSLLTVVRHTRAEEEAGRRELLGSAAVGRHAALAAALLVTGSADLLVGVLVAAALIACGLPVAGAMAMGLSFASVGWIFAAIAAVAAQLVESARAANGIAGATLGAGYLARAVGDAGLGGLSWLSWASPIGWSQRIRPFAGERWWICAVAAAVAAVLAAAAHALSARRDLGTGIVPPRSGPATASRRLSGALGLAWRLQRGTLFGWTIAFAVVGAALGGVAQGLAELLNSSPRLRMIVATLAGQVGIVDAYFTSVLGMLGLVASGYAVQATLRLRSEEEEARAEPVLATSVSRLRWATGHLIFAALGPAIALVTAGLTAGLAHGGRGDVRRLIAAALVQLPAVWVLGGITLALFGLAPRFARASWGVLAAGVVLGQLGPLLRLPPWVMNLSPFTHVPRLPGGVFEAAPLLALQGVAALLTIAGLLGWQRRDVG
jgi:ABC-2 type transport system permease protein